MSPRELPVCERGEFLFIAPGVQPAISLSDTSPARAPVARNDPGERDTVVPCMP